MTLFVTALAAATLAAPAPLTLDEPLAEASRKSPDLRIARANRDAALGERTVPWSNVLPRLDLTASFGRLWVGESSTAVTPGLVITNPAVSSISFHATTSVTPTGVAWSVDSSVKGLATGGGVAWDCTWPISALPDGQYVIGAQAYNGSGTY